MNIGHHMAETTKRIMHWSLMVIFCHQPMVAAFAQQWDSAIVVGTEVAAVAGHQQQLQ